MLFILFYPLNSFKNGGAVLVIGVGMTISGFVAVPFTGIIGLSLSMSFDIFLAFAGIILIGTIFAYTAFLKGASMVGPVKSSLLASIEPISAVFFAFMIMGDIFYPVDFLGSGN